MNADILNQVQKLKHDFRIELNNRQMSCISKQGTLLQEAEERISHEMGFIYYQKLRLIMAKTTMKEDLISTLGNVIFDDMKVSDWLIFKACMD